MRVRGGRHNSRSKLQRRRDWYDNMPHPVPPGYGTPPHTQSLEDGYKRPGSTNDHKQT